MGKKIYEVIEPGTVVYIRTTASTPTVECLTVSSVLLFKDGSCGYNMCNGRQYSEHRLFATPAEAFKD